MAATKSKQIRTYKNVSEVKISSAEPLTKSEISELFDTTFITKIIENQNLKQDKRILDEKSENKVNFDTEFNKLNVKSHIL